MNRLLLTYLSCVLQSFFPSLLTTIPQEYHRIEWEGHHLQLDYFYGKPIDSLIIELGNPYLQTGSVESDFIINDPTFRDIVRAYNSENSNIAHIPVKAYLWAGNENSLRVYCVYDKFLDRFRHDYLVADRFENGPTIAEWLSKYSGNDSCRVLFCDILSNNDIHDPTKSILSYSQRWSKYLYKETIGLKDYYYNKFNILIYRPQRIRKRFKGPMLLSQCEGQEREAILGILGMPDTTYVDSCLCPDEYPLCDEIPQGTEILIDTYWLADMHRLMVLYREDEGAYHLLFAKRDENMNPGFYESAPL